MTSEDVNAQLFLQLNDRFGNTGLRGKQRLGGLGQVEVLPNGLSDEAKLMKIHDLSRKKTINVFTKEIKQPENQAIGDLFAYI